MPEQAPTSIEQPELYRELVDNYAVINQHQWQTAKDHLHKFNAWPDGYGWDYLIVETIDGIDYWLPNDESWFDIMAVDHTNKLAIGTGFPEMDDLSYPDSEYAFTECHGILVPKFVADRTAIVDHYKALTTDDLLDQLQDTEQRLGETESQHQSEVAAYGDSWPGACLQINDMRVSLACMREVLTNRHGDKIS